MAGSTYILCDPIKAAVISCFHQDESALWYCWAQYIVPKTAAVLDNEMHKTDHPKLRQKETCWLQ